MYSTKSTIYYVYVAICYSYYVLHTSPMKRCGFDPIKTPILYVYVCACLSIHI